MNSLTMLLVVLLATIFPLPDPLLFYRPDWGALWVIYTVLWSRRAIPFYKPWLWGLILDIVLDYPLGLHALAFALMSYMVERFKLQVRVFPWWQQLACVAIWLMAYHIVLVWSLAWVGRPVQFQFHLGSILLGMLVWLLGVFYSRNRRMMTWHASAS